MNPLRGIVVLMLLTAAILTLAWLSVAVPLETKIVYESTVPWLLKFSMFLLCGTIIFFDFIVPGVAREIIKAVFEIDFRGRKPWLSA